MVLPAFDNTLGALLIGGLTAMALWGITCVQTFTFFTRKHHDQDHLALSFMVAFLCVLDTFDSALNAHILYFYMVSNYLNPTAITKPVWSVLIHVTITSISNFIIRTLFAQRVYKLSHGNIPVTALIMALSVTDVVSGFVITIKAFGIASYMELDKLSHIMYLIFATGTASDASIAIALCTILYKSRTGLSKTDSLIKSLVMYTVNTGLIVALDATLGMVLYIVMPRNFIFLGFYLLLSKLYLNSYLACLNAREDLRAKIDQTVTIHLSQVSAGLSGHHYSAPTIPPSTNKRDIEALGQMYMEKSDDRDPNGTRVY